MRVYVESNFLLELVLEQESMKSCEELLDQADRRQIQLVVPALALFEPFTTLARHHLENIALNESVKGRLQYLERTSSLRDPVQQARQANDRVLVQSGGMHQERFEDLRDRLLRCAEVLPLDGETFRALGDGASAQLTLPDALIYLAVLRDCQRHRGAALFINLNRKDFDRDVRAELDRHGCTMKFKFADGVAWVQNALRAGES